MRTAKHRRRAAHSWTEAKLQKVTDELTREGLFSPETRPMLPRSMRFSVGAFASQCRNYDTDITPKKRSPLDILFSDLPSERVELFTSKCHLFLHDDPTANIIRRSSQSLRESICRDLVESGQLDSYPTTFRLTAFLISRGIRDKETIEELFDHRLLSYKEFESEQPKVERLISSAKTHYFENRKDIPDLIKPELWKKLDTVWSNLSIKQRSALDIHIMSEDPVSLEKGAKRLKISKASFKERIQSGIKKITRMIPELQSPAKILQHSRSNIKTTHNNFRKRRDAPKLKDLHKWIENTSIETRYLDQMSVFKTQSKKQMRD